MTQVTKKYINWTSCASKDSIKKAKGQAILQNIYVIRDWYLDYMKNFYNTIKRQPNYKSGQRS